MLLPCKPVSRMNAPYAVVAGDSGVVFSSSSVTPHSAQYDRCIVTSLMMLIIVPVAAWMDGNVDDFAASSLPKESYQHWAQ